MITVDTGLTGYAIRENGKTLQKFKLIKIQSYNRHKEKYDKSLDDRLDYIASKHRKYFAEEDDIDGFLKIYSNKKLFRKDSNAIYYFGDKYFLIFDVFTMHDVKLQCVWKYTELMKHNLYKIFTGYKWDDVSHMKRAILCKNTNKYVRYEFLEFMLKAYNIVYNGENIYRNFTKRCSNGKIRILSEPHLKLKPSLRAMNKYLYSKLGSTGLSYQYAYKKGRSIVDNAIPHKNNEYLFKADITNFFPSCKRELVRPWIRYMYRSAKEVSNRTDIINTNEDVALEDFLDMILVDDALCLGNPISPIIATAIIHKAAIKLRRTCRKCDIVFTQYCDDLTFSSSRPISKEFIIAIFNTAYRKAGLADYFQLKPSKMYGLKGQYRNITGIAFDHTNNNEPTPRRYLYRELRAEICNYAHGANVNLKKVKGQIAYMFMVGKGERIVNYLQKYNLVNELVSPNLLAKLER